MEVLKAGPKFHPRAETNPTVNMERSLQRCINGTPRAAGKAERNECKI
jgi:hypothetical protein